MTWTEARKRLESLAGSVEQTTIGAVAAAALAEVDRLTAEVDLARLHFKAASEILTGVEIERDKALAACEALDELQRYYGEHACDPDGMPGNEFYRENAMAVVRLARAALAGGGYTRGGDRAMTDPDPDPDPDPVLSCPCRAWPADTWASACIAAGLHHPACGDAPEVAVTPTDLVAGLLARVRLLEISVEALRAKVGQ